MPRGLNLNDGVPAKSLPRRAFDAGLAAKYPRINAPPRPNARGYIFDSESDDAMPCTIVCKADDADAGDDDDDDDDRDDKWKCWNELWDVRFSEKNGGGVYAYRFWQLFASREGCRSWYAVDQEPAEPNLMDLSSSSILANGANAQENK